VPSEANFSRAFADFAHDQLPQQLHQHLVTTHADPRLVGHVSRDATGSAVKVTVISTRTEGELIFLCPTLAAGTWHVEVRRTYGTATPVVRTGELSAALTVA